MSSMGFGIFLLAVHTVFGQFSSGGPSTFGYDASSACSKPYSRSGRAHFEKLPCDFSRQNWCTVAGNAYPWQAVRRFVHENQGLMRRMYGDEKHINVLKSELEKNDIELEYEERYKRHFDESWFSTNEEDNDFISENEKSSEGRAFTSELPEFHEFTRSNFQPTETTIESSTSSSSSISSSLASSATSSTTPTALPSADADEPEKSTMKSPITLSEIARVKNSSLNEIPGPLEVAKEDLSERTVTEAANGTEVSSDTTLEPKATPATSTATADRTDASEDDGESIVEDHDEKQFRPRPEYRPDAKPDGSSIEGQLFQDVAAKDHIKHPVLPLIGVNACPVKEEIVAPFWANNTRGEVLALLNLYPFEQYVHWEKCTHENQQMYCRQGCRCEQQYRLHRLLAYDPNNECRGIFSDWFKFPSCCVCRCYDLPIEFRVTSRSPRVRKQRVKLRPPGGRGKP